MGSLGLRVFKPFIFKNNFKHTYSQALSSVRSFSDIKKDEFSHQSKEGGTKSYPGHKIQVDGMQIHYEQVGKGNHKVLLLPGALGSSRTDFGPQLELLDKKKFTLIAWDPPGYGYSRPPDRKFVGNFYFTDATIASKMMQRLGHAKYSIMGWSDGGNTAMIMAALNPTAVDKMVIWGCNAYITVIDKALVEAAGDIDDWSPKMKAPMLNLYGEDYFKKTWQKFVDAIQNNFKEDEDNICREVLPNIHCPTLIVHGDKDPMIDPEHPIFLKSNITKSKLVRLPEGKHNLHLRYAKEFNAIAEDFLQV